MFLGVGVQPVTQGSVWIGWCRCCGFMALGGAMLPGHAASEPLADTQHTLEVANGRSPAFRA